jgi:hypothetical protein
MDVRLSLSIDDLVLLIEALDCYEYWELGRVLPRNNGAVLIPGDHLGGVDPYWSAPPTDEQAEAIEVVQRSRRLSARLQDLIPDGADAD